MEVKNSEGNYSGYQKKRIEVQNKSGRPILRPLYLFDISRPLPISHSLSFSKNIFIRLYSFTGWMFGGVEAKFGIILVNRRPQQTGAQIGGPNTMIMIACFGHWDTGRPWWRIKMRIRSCKRQSEGPLKWRSLRPIR